MRAILMSSSGDYITTIDVDDEGTEVLIIVGEIKGSNDGARTFVKTGTDCGAGVFRETPHAYSFRKL